MKRLLVAVCALILSMPAWGQEEPAEMSEEQEMMANWMEAAAPGPEHEMLASMTGDWEVKAMIWMAPDAEPMETSGHAEREMILDGRVLVERYEGDFMGMKFVGQGMTGYDNLTDSWWGTWSDTFSTSVMVSHGQCTEKMDTCTFISEGPDPMTGKMTYMKSVMKVVGKDKEIMEGYTIGPDGKEIKTMELVYTRKK